MDENRGSATDFQRALTRLASRLKLAEADVLRFASDLVARVIRG